MKKIKKMPIFKEDLEFEKFHTQTLQEIENDKINFKKEYFNKVTKELSSIEKKERISVLEDMILDNNNEDVSLEGLNQLDRQEEIYLENEVLFTILKNYQTILVSEEVDETPSDDSEDKKEELAVQIDDTDKEVNEENIIYQTSYFDYHNPHTFDEKLGILYKNLKNEGYISCSKPAFRSVFSKNNNYPKVNWLKSQSSFQFFIKQLVAKENIFCKELWVVSAACFLINGKEKTNKQLGKVEEPSSIDALLIRKCIKDFL